MEAQVLVKTSPSVMQANSTCYRHPLTLALMPLLQVVSALPGLTITTIQRLAHAKLGLTAILRPRFLINLETLASLRTQSLNSTVPTKTSTSTLQHVSVRPSLYAMRANNQSVTLAILLQTVTLQSPQSTQLWLETTSTQVILNAQKATVSAHKIDAPTLTSSLKLKGGSLTQTNVATKHFYFRMIPLLGQQQSIPNGMTSTKVALSYTILLLVGELGEQMRIPTSSIMALSRRLERGIRKVLPI